MWASSCVVSAAPETIDDDLLVLAVKPQIAATVLASLKGKLSASTTVLSIIAGIDSGSLATMLGLTNTSTIIRCMPNTPSMVNEGMTALLANDQCSESGRMLAEQVMAAVGKTLWVQEESDLDIVTAISGSGPAYFFLFMESLTEAAIKLGMSFTRSSVTRCSDGRRLRQARISERRRPRKTSKQCNEPWRDHPASDTVVSSRRDFVASLMTPFQRQESGPLN
jgi:pyrroline-5-carboxylate reductase